MIQDIGNMEWECSTTTWCTPSCGIMTSTCCDEPETISLNKKFNQVASGLHTYINSVAEYNYRTKQEEISKEVEASADYKTLATLIDDYRKVQRDELFTSFFMFKKSNELKAKKKNITEQVKETAIRIGGIKFIDAAPYVYLLHEVVDTVIRNKVKNNRHLNWDEVKAKLHMIKDWEDKTFAELVEIIADKPETNEEVIGAI